MRRKKERSKQGQTNKQGKAHSTPKAVTFPRKNELPRVAAQLAGPMYVYIIDCKGRSPDNIQILLGLVLYQHTCNYQVITVRTAGAGLKFRSTPLPLFHFCGCEIVIHEKRDSLETRLQDIHVHA